MRRDPYRPRPPNTTQHPAPSTTQHHHQRNCVDILTGPGLAALRAAPKCVGGGGVPERVQRDPDVDVEPVVHRRHPPDRRHGLEAWERPFDRAEQLPGPRVAHQHGVAQGWYGSQRPKETKKRPKETTKRAAASRSRCVNMKSAYEPPMKSTPRDES